MNLKMQETKTIDTDSTSGIMGHPRGLVNLFFTEMWERFSYYGMRAILILYMVAAVGDGGLGMDMKTAGMIYGLYTMSVYLTSLPGGFIADRFLGQRKAVLIGGIIIACGNIFTAMPSREIFFLGMLTIVLGTGLLKPNISSMLGMLYKEGDPRRDAGFSIFYMGINIGAFLSPLVCGFLAQSNEFKSWLVSMNLPATSSWHWGFGAPALGMILGLVHYVLQGRLLGEAELKPHHKAGVVEKASQPLTKDELKRLGAIGVLFFFNILFWAVYEQGGTSLNVFADRCTRCQIFGWQFPSAWMQSFQAIYVIIFAPVFSYIWLKMGSKQPTSPAKFAIGLFFLGLGIALMVPAAMLAGQGKVSPLWLVVVYFLEVIGELCLSPVGLSTVTKLAPARFVGLTMGAWFIGTALGNGLAGSLGGLFDDKDIHSMSILFGSMALAAFLGAGILSGLVPLVKKLMGKMQ